MNPLIALLLAGSMTIAPVTQATPPAQAPEIQLPETIRVAYTGDPSGCNDGYYRNVVEMDFKEYVTGVLAAEWGNRWHINSLKAGAIAVKMFAWAKINEDPAIPSWEWAPEREADVWDCVWDQAYKPEWINDKVRRAVDETWDYVLFDLEGEVFETKYDDWYSTCVGRKADGTCMGQWETYFMALEGSDWVNILLSFYEGQVLSTDLEYVQAEVDPNLDGQWIEGESNAYVVKAGDTLIDITKAWYGTKKPWKSVWQANSHLISNPSLIRVGTVLIMPDL